MGCIAGLILPRFPIFCTSPLFTPGVVRLIPERMVGEMSAAARRYVDMWAFLGMHPTNIEILQRLKSADDRQFGSQMDVCGNVSQLDAKTGKWEPICLAGIRSDIWNPDKSELEKTLRTLHNQRREYHRRAIKKTGALSDRQQQRLSEQLSQDELLSLCVEDIEKRRLVMKLFRTTGQRIRWTGTLEEVTTREIHNSIGSRRAVLSMVAILPGYEYLTIVQENHRTFRIPPIYTFCFYDVKNMRTWYVSIKRKWFSIGADYVIESAGATDWRDRREVDRVWLQRVRVRDRTKPGRQ